MTNAPMPADPHNIRGGAEQTANDLRAAFERHGLDFPELGVSLPAAMAGYVVINTGSITADTARRLTDLLLATAT